MDPGKGLDGPASESAASDAMRRPTKTSFHQQDLCQPDALTCAFWTTIPGARRVREPDALRQGCRRTLVNKKSTPGRATWHPPCEVFAAVPNYPAKACVVE